MKIQKLWREDSGLLNVMRDLSLNNIKTLYHRVEAHIMTLHGPFSLKHTMRRARVTQGQRVYPSSKMSAQLETRLEHIEISYRGAATPTHHAARQPTLLHEHQGFTRGVYQYPVDPELELAERPLLVLAPGLGGDERSSYTRWIAERALQLGYATLIISPRGSGESSPGYYHAGWYQDLVEACAHRRIARHSARYLVGFSMGGHIAGRLACDPKTRGLFNAIFTCCSPMCLKSAQHNLDHHTLKVYQRYLLKGIKRVARGLLEAERARLPLTDYQIEGLTRSLKAQAVQDFDHYAITRLLGYRDADDYYASESLTQALAGLHTPMTWALNRHDPFIPYTEQRDTLHTLTQHDDLNALLTLQVFERGGHIYGRSRHGTALSAIPDWLYSHYPRALAGAKTSDRSHISPFPQA